MLETWVLALWLVFPNGGVTKHRINGFETKRECLDYGQRYRNIEYRWQAEFLCEAGR
jgi:hypothetical protein